MLPFKCFPVEKEALKEKLLSVSFDMLCEAKNGPTETCWAQGVPALPSEQLTWNRHHILEEDSSPHPAEQSSGLLQLGHHPLGGLKRSSLHSLHTSALASHISISLLVGGKFSSLSIKAQSVTLGRRPLPGQSLMEGEGSNTVAPIRCSEADALPANPSQHIKSLD